MPQSPQRVEFEGQVHEFPPDFTDADIQKALAGHTSAPDQSQGLTQGQIYQQRRASGQLPKGEASTTFQASYDPNSSTKNFLANVGEGGIGALKTGLDIGKDLASNPNWAATMPAGQRPSTMQKYVTDPARAMVAKGGQALGEGRYSEAAGYGGAAALPGIGPWAASMGEQAGAGDISGAAGQLVGGLAGGKAGAEGTSGLLDTAVSRSEKLWEGLDQRAYLNRIIENTQGLTRQAKTLNVIDKAAQGSFNKIKESLTVLQSKLKADAQQSMQPFIEADKARGEAAILPTQAAANAAAALSVTDYTPKPAEQALLDQLSATPQDRVAKQLGYQDAEQAKAQVGSVVFDDFVRKGAGGIKAEGLTLDQTLKLRTAIGSALSRAKDPKAIKVLTSAYDGMNDSINGRLNELQGLKNAVDSSGKPTANKAFTQYNKNYKAAFQLTDKDSFTAPLMEETLDHHDARNRLKDFTDSNLTEVAQQMKDKGMNPQQIYQLQKDAKSVLAARDSVMGRYNKSLRGLMGGSPSEAALPIGVYAMSRGAGLYGIVPYMLAVMAGRIPKNMSIMSDFTATLKRLGISDKAINTRAQPGPFEPQSPGPPTQPPTGGGPPVPPAGPSSPSPEEEAGNRKFMEWAQQRKERGVERGPKEMAPNLESLWQEGALGKAPTEDIGAKARAASQEKVAQLKKAKAARR